MIFEFNFNLQFQTSLLIPYIIKKESDFTMASKVNTTEEEVTKTVSSLYSQLLEKRRIEKEELKERKQKEKEERQREKAERKEREKEDPTLKMTKKQRQEAAFESWKEVVVGLTGDDLDYSKPKKKKKKYRKWIDDEDDKNTVLTQPPKKHKKKNYNKEFEPELHMLKALIADQNKFTVELQKRFQNAAGPATKDAMPLNKTLVDLAAAVVASRNNSLGLLKEVGALKKTIADLYMRQKKQEYELTGGKGESYAPTDLGLLGSNVAASLFGDNAIPTPSGNTPNAFSQATMQSSNPYPTTSDGVPIIQAQALDIEEFDPSSWGGASSLGENNSVMFENIPHSVVVEWHKDKGVARFKAVRDDTGEELVGCPVPTSDPSRLKFNEKDMTVKGDFDELFKLEIH